MKSGYWWFPIHLSQHTWFMMTCYRYFYHCNALPSGWMMNAWEMSRLISSLVINAKISSHGAVANNCKCWHWDRSVHGRNPAFLFPPRYIQFPKWPTAFNDIVIPRYWWLDTCCHWSLLREREEKVEPGEGGSQRKAKAGLPGHPGPLAQELVERESR